MAVDTTICPPGSAQLVGLVFVERYYKSVYQSPQDAHKFYLDFSELSRQGPDGEMTSFTTRQGINDAIMSSCGSKNFKVQLYTSDAQFSHEGGVVVLVTGCLTGKDNIKRNFIQTFFLVPQDKAYFVLNDVFRFIGNKDSVNVDESVVPNADHRIVNPASDSEPNHVVDQPLQNELSHVEVATEIENNISDPNVNEQEATPVAVQHVPKQNGIVSLIADSPSSANNAQVASTNDAQVASTNDAQVSSTNDAQVASPKKSYASMLMKIKSENNTAAAAPVHLAPTAVKPEPIRSEQKLNEAPAASEASTHSNNGTPKSINGQIEAKNFCIVIRNLPLTTKFNDVGKIFNKYGTIRRGSIQVISYSREKTAFAFVDYENAADMEKALKASPIKLDDGRVLTVEAKKVKVNGLRKDQGRGRKEVKEEENTTTTTTTGGGKPRVYIEIDEEGFQTKKKAYNGVSGRRPSLQKQN